MTDNPYDQMMLESHADMDALDQLRRKTVSEDEVQDKGMINCAAAKALCKEYEYRIGDGALNQLGKEVKLLIAKAIRRAENNGRKTIKEQDV